MPIRKEEAVYKRKASLAFRVSFILDDEPFALSGYTTPDEPYSDESKGKVTITVTNRATGDVQNDSDNVAIQDMVMLMDGSDNTKGVKTIPAGINADGEYLATVWYQILSGATLLRRDLETIAFSVKTDDATYMI